MAKLLYVDLGKKATDLLTKDFPDKTKVELNTRSPNGLQFKVIATRNHDGSISGSIEPKYTFGKHATTVLANVDTGKTFKVEGTVEKFPGIKATIAGLLDSESLKADLEWKHEHATVTTGLDLFSAKGTTASATAAVHHEGFSLGASTEYFIGDRQEVRKLDGVLAYSTSDLQVTAFSRRWGGVLGGTYFQKVSDGTSVSAEIQFDLQKSDVTPKLTFGASHNLDLQGTQVKGKFDTDGKLSLSYGQKLNNYLKFFVGANINTNNLGPSGNHTLGVALTFDA